jgi:hypothetical protein
MFVPSAIQIKILFIVFILMIWYFKFSDTTLSYVKGFDEDFHLVRDLEDKDMAADIMSEIKMRNEKLIKYLIDTYPMQENVMRLKNRYNEDNIKETDLNDSGTSYSVDKGKEISLCLRDKQTEELHKINLLMFVTLHELAHIMSKTYGHNQEFTDNFIFLLKEADKIGIYNPIDYSRNEEGYCGITVDDNPLF